MHLKLLAELQNFLGQCLDHAVALFQLKIAQALSNTALYRIRCVDVTPIEIKQQRLGIAVFQAFIPALRNDERCAHVVGKQIRFVLYLGRSVTPTERLVLGDNIDEFLRARCVVPIDQHARHVGQLARFKGVTEQQREQRWKQQNKKQHASVPINVQELLISDTRGRFE